MNVVIDMGNTRLKAGLFDKEILLESREVSDARQLKSWLKEVKPQTVMVASVAGPAEKLVAELTPAYKAWALNIHARFPFKIDYDTPHTLGVDRLASVAGGQVLYPGENLLVIDAGTSITYDFLSKQGVYHGGFISMGLRMRLKALHHFTARLPDLSQKKIENLHGDGKSTQEAILGGTVYGLVGEIAYFISHFHKKYGETRCIIAGGDAIFFESRLKDQIFAVQNLTLIGLNRILKYNAEGNI